VSTRFAQLTAKEQELSEERERLQAEARTLFDAGVQPKYHYHDEEADSAKKATDERIAALLGGANFVVKAAPIRQDESGDRLAHILARMADIDEAMRILRQQI